MRKFKRSKTLAEIKAQCEAQGVPIDTKLYEQMRSDYVTVGEEGKGHARYNCFNGQFTGYTPSKVYFHSSDVTHERKPWFNALLDFFYVA